MRLSIVIAAGVLALCAAAASAAEPSWWTARKRACGLSPSLDYNSWVRSGSPCNASRPSSSSGGGGGTSRSELRRERAGIKRYRDHRAAEAEIRAGDALGRQGDYEGALRHYRKASALWPSNTSMANYVTVGTERVRVQKLSAPTKAAITDISAMLANQQATPPPQGMAARELADRRAQREAVARRRLGAMGDQQAMREAATASAEGQSAAATSGAQASDIARGVFDNPVAGAGGGAATATVAAPAMWTAENIPVAARTPQVLMMDRERAAANRRLEELREKLKNANPADAPVTSALTSSIATEEERVGNLDILIDDAIKAAAPLPAPPAQQTGEDSGRAKRK